MKFPSQYDQDIKNATEKYLFGIDWRLVKAQYYQESGLDPEAVSPAGAMGIAQFMPSTWVEVTNTIGLHAAIPEDADASILAGAFYMHRMLATWTAPRPDADRYSLALASYNAGLGNILKAQELAGGANDYASIIASLPGVTGKNAAETTGYVKRIWGYWIDMVTG